MSAGTACPHCWGAGKVDLNGPTTAAAIPILALVGFSVRSEPLGVVLQTCALCRGRTDIPRDFLRMAHREKRLRTLAASLSVVGWLAAMALPLAVIFLSALDAYAALVVYVSVMIVLLTTGRFSRRRSWQRFQLLADRIERSR